MTVGPPRVWLSVHSALSHQMPRQETVSKGSISHYIVVSLFPSILLRALPNDHADWDVIELL